jgi:hypothetical protein
MEIEIKNSVPAQLEELIKTKLGEDEANLVLQEIDKTISLEYNMPPLVDHGRTEGDWNISLGDLTRDYRPTEALSFDIIEQMLKSAPIRFAVEMKRSQIVSVFRNQRSWKVHSSDRELAEVARASLASILPKMSLDFSFSSLVYGVSFQELVWERKSKFELGLSDTKYQSNRKFIVPKIPNSVNPSKVTSILRTSEGSFNGFIQRRNNGFGEIIVTRESSLVIPYNERYRNLWGESFLKPAYPIWFWYEVVLRSMVKYMERTATPVAVVKAPSKAVVRKPGTATKIDAITWGMEIASNVSRSNAAVIPSDSDENGKPLWELSYLSSTEKAQPFMDILELLTQMILRACLSADRALSQSSGGVGSYNIGEIHKEATALHNELILIQWLHYLNSYFLPHFSLYNRGTNGPTIWMETQGLDPNDKQNLNQLLALGNNMESFKEVSYQIDWETLLGINNIPMLDVEDADQLKNKIREESIKNQEETMQMQKKYETPPPAKQPNKKVESKTNE